MSQSEDEQTNDMTPVPPDSPSSMTCRTFSEALRHLDCIQITHVDFLQMCKLASGVPSASALVVSTLKTSGNCKNHNYCTCNLKELKVFCKIPFPKIYDNNLGLCPVSELPRNE